MEKNRNRIKGQIQKRKTETENTKDPSTWKILCDLQATRDYETWGLFAFDSLRMTPPLMTKSFIATEINAGIDFPLLSCQWCRRRIEGKRVDDKPTQGKAREKRLALLTLYIPLLSQHEPKIVATEEQISIPFLSPSSPKLLKREMCIQGIKQGRHNEWKKTKRMEWKEDEEAEIIITRIQFDDDKDREG